MFRRRRVRGSLSVVKKMDLGLNFIFLYPYKKGRVMADLPFCTKSCKLYFSASLYSGCTRFRLLADRHRKSERHIQEHNKSLCTRWPEELSLEPQAYPLLLDARSRPTFPPWPLPLEHCLKTYPHSLENWRAASAQ